MLLLAQRILRTQGPRALLPQRAFFQPTTLSPYFTLKMIPRTRFSFCSTKSPPSEPSPPRTQQKKQKRQAEDKEDHGEISEKQMLKKVWTELNSIRQQVAVAKTKNGGETGIVNLLKILIPGSKNLYPVFLELFEEVGRRRGRIGQSS